MTRVADQEQHRGGMIALIPREQDLDQLAVDGGDPVDQLHLTVAYLGDDVTGWSQENRDTLIEEIRELAQRDPIEARVMGFGRFNPDGGPDGDRDECMVYLVGDAPAIAQLQRVVRGIVENKVHVPEQHDPFIPHVTAGYGLEPEALTFTGPLTFDRFRIGLANDYTDIPLGGGEADDEDDDEQLEPADDETAEDDDEPLDDDDDLDVKGLVKRVRTARGVRHFGAPIGTVIKPGIYHRLTRENTERRHAEHAHRREISEARRHSLGEIARQRRTDVMERDLISSDREAAIASDPVVKAATELRESTDVAQESWEAYLRGRDDRRQALAVEQAKIESYVRDELADEPPDAVEKVIAQLQSEARAKVDADEESKRNDAIEQLRLAAAATGAPDPIVDEAVRAVTEDDMARIDVALGEKSAAPDGLETKKKVATKAGEDRYHKPIGTELGQSRGSEGANTAQADAGAKKMYEDTRGMSIEDLRKYAKGLSDADLQKLHAITYSFKSSDKNVVQNRTVLSAALRERGLDPGKSGSLAGKTGTGKGGSKAKAKPGAGQAKRKGGMSDVEDRAWRTEASSKGGSLAESSLTEAARKKLTAAGWTSARGSLHPPTKSILHGYLDDPEGGMETKRQFTADQRKKAHTIKGTDAFPIENVADLRNAIKAYGRAKDKAAAKAHIVSRAKALKATAELPDGWLEEKGARAVDWVLDETDRATLAVIAHLERKFESPDPRARRLRKYWSRGPGRRKWNTFRELRRHLSKYVPTHMLNGLTANIYHAAKGEWPGRRAHKDVEPEVTETKVMIDPELVAQFDAMGDDDDPEADLDALAETQISTEEEYESALAADVDWDMEADGDLVEADDEDGDSDNLQSGPGLLDDDYEVGEPEPDLLTAFRR